MYCFDMDPKNWDGTTENASTHGHRGQKQQHEFMVRPTLHYTCRGRETQATPLRHSLDPHLSRCINAPNAARNDTA